MLSYEDNDCHQHFREEELHAMQEDNLHIQELLRIFKDRKKNQIDSFKLTIEEEINFIMSKRLEIMKTCRISAGKRVYKETCRDISDAVEQVLHSYFG
jgi:hypothetical protein